MNSNSNNMMAPSATTVAHPHNGSQGTHHHRNRSCNDGLYAPHSPHLDLPAKTTATMMVMNNLNLNVSSHHYLQQSPTADTTPPTSSINDTLGRKSSLVGFDPFSSVPNMSKPLSIRLKTHLSIDTSLNTGVNGFNADFMTGPTAPVAPTSTKSMGAQNYSRFHQQQHQQQQQRGSYHHPSSPHVMGTTATTTKAMIRDSSPTNSNSNSPRRQQPPPSPPIPASISIGGRVACSDASRRTNSPVHSNGDSSNVNESKKNHCSDAAEVAAPFNDTVAASAPTTPNKSSRKSKTLKFLRKSTLVKSLSLGRVDCSNKSSSSSNDKATSQHKQLLNLQNSIAASTAIKSTSCDDGISPTPLLDSKMVTTSKKSYSEKMKKKIRRASMPSPSNKNTKATANVVKGRASMPSPSSRNMKAIANVIKGRASMSSPLTKSTKATANVVKGHASMPSPSSKNMKSIANVTTTSTSTPPDDTFDAEGKNNSTVNTSRGIVQELMESKDKFGSLSIPPLAKPSPTSFLTGKTEETVRTSEYEPSPYQLEIPSLSEVVTIARLNELLDDYRNIDQNLDLQQFVGLNRMDLKNNAITIEEHIPIVHSLLECGDDQISIQGYISKIGSEDDSTDGNSNNNDHPDNRSEAVIFHGKRYFTVVFRGTKEQQSKILSGGSISSSKSKKRAVSIGPESENVEVYNGFYKDSGYTKLEREVFTLVDKLTEENPFTDVVFTGYSFGAAMATMAAYRYATARPMMRVGCIPFGSPKVGFSHFRHVVNSLSNLKVMRIELGQDSKCERPTVGGWHVGHTLVLSSGSSSNPASLSSLSSSNGKPQMKIQPPHTPTQTSKGNKSAYSVLAYQFDTPKHKSKFFAKNAGNPDLKKYISTLEEMSTLNSPWAKDFVNTSGEGVVINNESRQVV